MTVPPADLILAAFLIFCRIGACLMVMPGFGSARLPMKTRLFIALGVTLALTPPLVDIVLPLAAGADPARVVVLIVTESLVGLKIGTIARLFYMALQTMTHAIANFIGFGGMPGAPVEDTESLPPVTTLVTMTATALLFITDLHWEVFRGLVASYTVMPPALSYQTRLSLVEITDRIGEAFILSLRIASPFLIFGVVANLALGLINKLAQQIPIYFVSMPLMLGAGLFGLYFLVGEFLGLFHAGFAAWLTGR
ncbi:flagellar biosynthesis protein FliR [Salinarimonas soli]|uniref:Flagellar biosynthesis protein FliR n=1 Tax=Salinarimonas soli TaxID=1638099 RepID=A0A5B2V911_9HYPH|nr:flagellar biosynthesis protein FliR [Salinarimonas soli]KAA2234717.1 flagellar biosynthesis protein FliR [Salinarimonas soli]